MADELTAINKVQDRIGGLERIFERLDERMDGKLGKDDATRLMEYASDGDRRLREDVGGRITDFRVEFRDAFKHAEKEYMAALYRSSTESEARLGAQISALATSMTALTSQLSALSSAPEKVKGMNPFYPLIGGTGLGGAIVYLVLVFLGLAPRLGG